MLIIQTLAEHVGSVKQSLHGNTPHAAVGMETMNVMAVSYTHLDVYKRQVLHREDILAHIL